MLNEGRADIQSLPTVNVANGQEHVQVLRQRREAKPREAEDAI